MSDLKLHLASDPSLAKRIVNHETGRTLAEETTAPKQPKRRKAGEMNDWETKYSRHLDRLKMEGKVRWWAFEAWTFKLAPRTTYTPDFLVCMADGSLKFAEVKGFERDDAAVKFKTAAAANPWADWQTLRLVRGAWEVVRDHPSPYRGSNA